jgi:kumamolisin
MSAIQGSELIHLPTARAVGAPAPNELITVSVILHRKSPPLASLVQVENFARQHSLAVVESSAARRTIVLSGTLAQMATAFGVRFMNYSASGVTYRGYEGKITIPDDLAAVVVAVLGLDNRPAAEPRFVVVRPADLSNR